MSTEYKDWEPFEGYGKKREPKPRESARERAHRRELEAEASQIAADAPLVAALLGLGGKP